MSDDLRREIDQLKAQVAALSEERLPNVDTASKRRDRRQVLGGFALFAMALLSAGAVSASALSGSNTVLSDDIKNTEVHGEDINSNAVSGAKVKDGSLTTADIANGSLTGDDLAAGLLYLAPVGTTSIAPNDYGTSGSSCGANDYAIGTQLVSVPTSLRITGSIGNSLNGLTNIWTVNASNTSTTTAAALKTQAICLKLRRSATPPNLP